MTCKTCALGYGGPRWSGEILDCSMPVTMDTYSVCSFGCLYCFSFFQRINISGANYLNKKLRALNVEKFKRVFTEPESSAFRGLIRERKAIQWGSLSDQFDNFERKHGISLELLRFFREINYPISMSTKGVWWLKDDRYRDAIRGAKNFHFKLSIITTDEKKAKRMEVGVPTVAERLWAIEELKKLDVGGVTLRFRPFIIGMSNPDHQGLIRAAGQRGADSMSTEFFCLESRAGARLKDRYKRMGEILGYDVFKFYLRHSKRSGYKRLNRKLKKPYIMEMKEEAERQGMRFYVSDNEWKELSHHGSCCGIPEDWNYQKGQFTEAAVICRKEGRVCFEDIGKHMGWAKEMKLMSLYGSTTFLGTNAGAQKKNKAQMGDWSMYDYYRYMWNHPNLGNSPYKYFGGALYPEELDDEGDVVYTYKAGAGLS